MLTIITGAPGAGKTLYALHYVKAWAERENREVYYSGIKDLRLPWIELEDPSQWFKLPVGSIIVIDEAQRVFRQRAIGAAVPQHVSELETHRHKGFDIVLITQHPKLLDSNVRRLIGRHFHVVRTFGLQRATVHEWGELEADCETGAGRKDSIRHEWGYPKDLYALYHSAEVHTHKRRVPARVMLLLFLPLLLGLLVYLAVSNIKGWVDKPHAIQALEKRGAVPEGGAQVSGQPGRAAARAPTVAEYLAVREARVPGLAYTAAVYDSVTAPSFAPYPAACVASAAKCRCYTDQATRLEVPEALCRSLAERGFFLEWEPKRAQSGGNGGGAPIAKPEARLAAPDASSGHSQLDPPPSPAKQPFAFDPQPRGRPARASAPGAD